VLLDFGYHCWEDLSSPSMLDEYERPPMHLLTAPDFDVTAFLQGPLRRVLAVHGIVERASLPACGSDFAAINMALAALHVSKAVPWGPLVFVYLLPRVDIDGRPLPAAVGEIKTFLSALNLVALNLLVVAGKGRRSACLDADLAAVHCGTDALRSIRLDVTAVDELRAGLCRASLSRKPTARAVLRRAARACAAASVGAPAPAGVAVEPVSGYDNGGGADAAVTVEHMLPRSPNVDSKWVKTFPHADTRKGLTNCLAADGRGQPRRLQH